MEILTKLQFMMQSQWNEAVSLLVTTPQKKVTDELYLWVYMGNSKISLHLAGKNKPFLMAT